MIFSYFRIKNFDMYIVQYSQLPFSFSLSDFELFYSTWILNSKKNSKNIMTLHCLKSYFFQLVVSKWLLSITNMFVIDQKEKVSLINH